MKRQKGALTLRDDDESDVGDVRRSTPACKRDFAHCVHCRASEKGVDISLEPEANKSEG